MHINLFKKLLLLLGVSLVSKADIPTSENEQYIKEIIYSYVRTGFHSISDIKNIVIETVEDNGFEKEFPKSWINSKIKQEHQKLLTESKKWEKPTDVDLLIKAFNKLMTNGIISLHNAGYTNSDGEEEVREVVTLLKNKSIKNTIGYCFYHQQDLERALRPTNPILSLSFGALNNTTYNTIEIGQKIVNILQRYHFQVKWNGSADEKIEIIDFKWQKLYNPNVDLADYTQVMKLLPH